MPKERSVTLFVEGGGVWREGFCVKHFVAFLQKVENLIRSLYKSKFYCYCIGLFCLPSK